MPVKPWKRKVTASDIMFRDAEIDGPYRYALARRWDANLRTLVVVGLNPSTADATLDDATIRVLIGYAQRLKFGSLYMLNLYAYRSTDPKNMLAASHQGVDVIGPRNSFDHLRARIKVQNNPLVYAAWGSYGRERGDQFIYQCVRQDFAEIGEHLKCFSVNRDGSPHHPLHISLSGPINPYKGSAHYADRI